MKKASKLFSLEAFFTKDTVEMQGVEPWSEHGLRRAFYMFSWSYLSGTKSRPTYLVYSVSSQILPRSKKPVA